MSLWLAKDQESNEVAALQNALNLRLESQKPLVVDGIFGNHTEAAVRDFQKCQGFKVDGIAGPQTLGELFVCRTIVNKFVITTDGAAQEETEGGSAGSCEPKVGAPFYPSSLPLPNVPPLVQAWSAWFAKKPPKPPLPDLPGSAVPGPAPPMPIEPGIGIPPRFPRLYPKLTLDERRSPRFEWLRHNGWAEFEYAFETANRLRREIEIVQSFSAIFVKLAPYAVPRVSLALGALDGAVGVQFSAQFFDLPILAWQLKHMAGNPASTGSIGLFPYIGTSFLFNRKDRKKETEAEFFAGVRLGATWTNETHAGRRERALEFKIFAGAVAAIMAVRQKNAEGAVYSPPFVGKVMLQIGGALGIGRQHNPRRRH